MENDDLRAEPGRGADADTEGLGDADDDGRQERAADAAEPAHHRDDEGVGDDREIELEVGGFARDLQRPAQPRQHGAHEEHRGEELGLVDAQRPHHLAILGGRPHQRPPARAGEQQPQDAQHDRADGDQQQVVGRDALAQEFDGHPETRCARPDQILGAPGEQCDVLDHQHDREGRQKLEQLGRAVDAAQHQHLDQDADDADRERGQDHRAPEARGRAAQRLDQRVGAVQPQHVERTVREIHDPRHAEDQRQAGRHQKQGRSGGQPIEELDEDGGEDSRQARHPERSKAKSRGLVRCRQGPSVTRCALRSGRRIH